VIIVAPHPDDELIGAYSLLLSGAVKAVWYVHDHSENNDVRRLEAIKCSKHFGFEPLFLEGTSELEVKVADLVYPNLVLPSIRDSHPQHKEVNRICRHKAVRFYSVDLNFGQKTVFNSLEANEKRQALDLIYTSQKSLWDNDASYYLFENLAYTDISVLSRVDYMVRSNGYGSVPTGVVSNVHLDLENRDLRFTPIELVNALIKAGATKFKFEIDQVEYSL
jgi:LmbE family N-acetylglucosaminyl deacetylase